MAASNPEPSTPSTGAQFPSTCWSRVLGRSQDGEESRRRDLEHLAQGYWKPVYGYVARRWGLAADAALDATQDFFVWLLETAFLAKASRERGSFRAFLKTALRNFLIDRQRKSKRIKAGGAHAHFSWALDGEAAPGLEPHARGADSPEEVLDTLWRREIVEHATAALEDELREAERETYFAVFADYFLASEQELDYKKLAEKYDLNAHQVSNYLRHAKLRYRVHLRNTVMATVSDTDQLEDELDWLFRGVRT